jgi:uncharacterized protein YllA (UPF0747 family)
MYTLYKIASAAATARNIHASLDVPAVAVFWLEDNDHDAAEASTAHLATNDGIESVTAWDGTDPGDLCHLAIIQQANPQQLHLQSQR